MTASVDELLTARRRYERLRSKCKTALQRSVFAEQTHQLAVEWDIKVTQAHSSGWDSGDCSISGVVVHQGCRLFGRRFEASADLPGQRDRATKLKPGDIVRVSGKVDLGSVSAASCHIIDGSIVGGA